MDGLSSFLALVGAIPSAVPLAALVTFGIYKILSGGWVPRRQLDDVRKDRDSRLAEMKIFYETRETERETHKDEVIEVVTSERDVVRRGYQAQEETIRTLLSQNAELKEIARTGVNILNAALPQPPENHPGSSHRELGDGRGRE